MMREPLSEHLESLRHTPGPWEITDRFGDQSILIGPKIAPVATAWATSDCRTDVEYDDDGIPLSVDTTDLGIEANARLIAAAPDLLAACVEISKWRSLNEDGELNKSRLLVLAAIEKATGHAGA